MKKQAEDNKTVDCRCPKFRSQMFQGEFGLEMEMLRVDGQGRLAQTLHPFTEEAFSRDFAECQLEMVTPVCHSTRELYETMEAMRGQAVQVLGNQKPAEYLWPSSNPGIVDGEIPIARFTGELAWKSQYRNHLSQVYGREKMLFSGIHYNFSFPKELIPAACRDEIYLNLARHLYQNAYIPVLLMSASPLQDASIMGGKPGETIRTRYASVRCSQQGYWNKKELYLDFSSVEKYVRSVQQHIDAGDVQLASELYLPVRLKSGGDHSVEGLTGDGISYVEYRMVDLNPLEPTGIDYRDLEFLHLFMIYLSFCPEASFTEALQHEAICNVKQAALLEPPETLVHQALDVLEDMKKFYVDEIELIEPYINYQIEKLEYPQRRYASRILEYYGTDYAAKMLQAGRK